MLKGIATIGHMTNHHKNCHHSFHLLPNLKHSISMTFLMDHDHDHDDHYDDDDDHVMMIMIMMITMMMIIPNRLRHYSSITSFSSSW